MGLAWDVGVILELFRNYQLTDQTIPECGKKAVTLMTLANTDECLDLAVFDKD